MLRGTLAATPRPLLLVCALFGLGAFFPTRFADVPGTSVGSYVSTVLIALPAALALWRFLGPRRAAVSLVVLSLFGYAIETVGVVTGFPYGPFAYGDSLGPKAFGLVPFLLPVTWAPLVLGAVGATAPVKPSSGASPARAVAWIASAAVLLALIDGVLDPGAVALGFWSYEGGGIYYGVPVSNYFGWILSSTLAAALVLALGRGAWGRKPPPPGLLDSALVATAFWTGVALYSGRVAPLFLGALLFAYLLRRRASLSASRP